MTKLRFLFLGLILVFLVNTVLTDSGFLAALNGFCTIALAMLLILVEDGRIQ